MATLKETKKRIGSAKTVSKITKAMKLISASKSKAAQAANFASRPYSLALYQMVANLWQITNPRLHQLLKNNQSPKIGHLIISTDKGLCGSLLTHLEDFLDEQEIFKDSGNTYVLLGKKGREMLARNNLKAAAIFELGFKKTSFEMVNPLVKLLTEGYLRRDFGQVVIHYTRFINNLKQIPTSKLLLPAVRPTTQSLAKDVALYEPDADSVLETLLPRYLGLQLYQAVLESVASEHAARMLAMDQASKNADEIIGSLTLAYNKIRQETITKELLEITATLTAL